MAHLLPPPILRRKFLCDRPLEIRPVEISQSVKGHVAALTVRQVWIRANGTVPGIRVHQYLLGYASDHNFLPSRFSTHGIGFLEKGIQIRHY